MHQEGPAKRLRPGACNFPHRLWDALFLNSQSKRNRKLLPRSIGTTAELLAQLVPVSPPQHPHRSIRELVGHSGLVPKPASLSDGGEGYCRRHLACCPFVCSACTENSSFRWNRRQGQMRYTPPRLAIPIPSPTACTVAALTVNTN